MNEFCGWAGTILNIDLTTGKIEKEPLTLDFARKYLGASGFNSIKLFELVGPEVDALSPENVLMFGAGPLSGTLAPGSARLTVTAKSPRTDIFGDSNMGGFFATEMKFAGYDQIVIRGKAKQPVYLWIDDDEAELRKASPLWGNSTWDTARMIREEVGDPDIQVACIGQAGENLVRIANIMCPTKRAAGKSGMGAVMGSKNLKAVAVRGSKGIAIARPGEFLNACKEIREAIKMTSEYAKLHEYGTTGSFDQRAPLGARIVRNFQRNLFPNWEAISGETLKRDFTKSMRACPACVIACGPFHVINSGEFAGVYGEGLELTTLAIGTRCDIDSMPALLKINELTNQYGIDHYGVMVVFSWAMDCYERGILTKEDMDGTSLDWGDYNAVIELIHKIARREGFGNILAEGEKRAPQLVGRDSEKFMYHIKGHTIIGTDPRTNKAHGFQLFTATRGGDHLKAAPKRMPEFLRETEIGEEMRKDPETLDTRSPKGKGMVVKWSEDSMAVHNASGMCSRTGGSLPVLTRLLSSATGVDFTEKELLQTGERIFNVQKAFNSRLGLTRKDDNLSVPEKIREPIKEGSYKGMALELDMMLDEYYETRGWDQQTGLQTREKLEELGLEHIADELGKLNAVK